MFIFSSVRYFGVLFFTDVISFVQRCIAMMNIRRLCISQTPTTTQSGTRYYPLVDCNGLPVHIAIGHQNQSYRFKQSKCEDLWMFQATSPLLSYIANAETSPMNVLAISRLCGLPECSSHKLIRETSDKFDQLNAILCDDRYTDQTKPCKQCRGIYYCSRVCQALHHDQHVNTCMQLSPDYHKLLSMERDATSRVVIPVWWKLLKFRDLLNIQNDVDDIYTNKVIVMASLLAWRRRRSRGTHGDDDELLFAWWMRHVPSHFHPTNLEELIQTRGSSSLIHVPLMKHAQFRYCTVALTTMIWCPSPSQLITEAAAPSSKSTIYHIRENLASVLTHPSDSPYSDIWTNILLRQARSITLASVIQYFFNRYSVNVKFLSSRNCEHLIVHHLHRHYVQFLRNCLQHYIQPLVLCDMIILQYMSDENASIIFNNLEIERLKK